MHLKVSGFKKRLSVTLALSCFLIPSLNQASAEESQETIGVTDTEIKIGATYPQSSGATYFYASFFAGANSYFDYINQAGGIYKRKIYLIAGDNQNLPTRSITATNDLIMKSRVFALFNSSPTTPTHLAMSSNVLRNRNVPDFYPTATYSGFRNTAKYPTLIAMGASSQQEARVAANFVRDYFPEKSFMWRTNMSEGDIEVDVKNAWSNIGFTVIPFSSDPNVGTIHISNSLPTFGGAKKPMIVSGRAISYTSRVVVFDPKDLVDVYAINVLPLVSDKSDEFVNFFEGLNKKYSNGAPFDSAFLEGANSAYVFSQALADTGPSPTRSGLVNSFRTKGGTFSTATYGKLDFGTGVSGGKATFYVAKFDGTSWSRVSDFYTNELDSNIVSKGSVSRTTLLPNGLPIMNAKASPASISCVKGKTIKVVTGSNPKCPTGFKKK